MGMTKYGVSPDTLTKEATCDVVEEGDRDKKPEKKVCPVCGRPDGCEHVKKP